MNQIELRTIKTPISEFLIGTLDEEVVLFDFKYRKSIKTLMAKKAELLDAEYIEGHNKLHDQVEQQITEYLKGERQEFDIPNRTEGTEFQQLVWKELQYIPSGTTIAYAELAKRIGNPKAVRAVGGANGKNVLAIIIPCHRVINANGDLQGYGGGLPLKKRLLKLEHQHSGSEVEEWF